MELLIIWVYVYQFSSGNEVSSFYINTYCLIEKKKKKAMFCCILSFKIWNTVIKTKPVNLTIIENLIGEFWRLPEPL